jgi:hypothetical protein
VEAKWRKALQIFTTDYGQTHGDIFTPTQLQIVDCIAKRRFSRIQLILPTQYGKSYSVADGVLLRASTHVEKWAIVAPTEDKARIIMDYIIDAIFDDEMLSKKLDYNGSKETLKKERSKTRITFRGGGEIRVYSANAGNTKQVRSALMGYGAPNIILDEAGQIGDELYATIKRMTGGSEGTASGTFFMEIGNPVFDNHFKKTWFGDGQYKKIFMNDELALAEGRFTREFLDEMEALPGYDWMYRCIFPEASEVLPNGYRRLITDSYVVNAYVEDMPLLEYRYDDQGNVQENQWGHKIVDDQAVLGVDVSGSGSNETRLIVRLPRHGIAFVAAVLKGNISDEDLEEVADVVEDVIRKWNIGDYRTMIDAEGVGYGLPAILRRRGYLVRAIHFGGTKDENGERKIPATFLNIKAYMAWELRKWMRASGGKLLRDAGFEEIKLAYYKANNTGKTQLEPKQDMIKRKAEEGVKVESPDTFDALILTFDDTSGIVEEDDIFLE